MPIDPNSGLIEQQVNPFPGGTFGPLITEGNAAQADRLATEAQNRRQLQDHMLMLQDQEQQQRLSDSGDLLKYEHDKRQHEEEGWADTKAYEQDIAANPDYTTQEMLRSAVIHGQKQNVAPFAQLQGKEDLADSRSDNTDLGYIKAFGDQTDRMDKMGIPKPKQADILQAQFGGKVPDEAFQTLRSGGAGATPMTQAIINQKGAAATKDIAEAGRAGKGTTAKDDAQEEKIDETLRKYDHDINVARMNVTKLPSPMQQNQARKQTVDPLIATRDAYAKKHGRPLIKPEAAPAPGPSNPSPPTTTVAPPASVPIKYPPNRKIKLSDGTIVSTDSQGEIVK